MLVPVDAAGETVQDREIVTLGEEVDPDAGRGECKKESALKSFGEILTL